MTSAASSPAEPGFVPSAPRFVHLRLHSEYSITDGIVQIDQAIAAAADDGMPALGISDLANLFGMVKFYKGARGKGVKPIVGVDAWIQNEAERDKPHRVLLICRNRAGYGQLCELLTRAYLDNKHRGRAEMRREWFENGAAADLLCLSGAMSGDIGAAIAAAHGDPRLRLFDCRFDLARPAYGRSAYGDEHVDRAGREAERLGRILDALRTGVRGGRGAAHASGCTCRIPAGAVSTRALRP